MWVSDALLVQMFSASMHDTGQDTLAQSVNLDTLMSLQDHVCTRLSCTKQCSEASCELKMLSVCGEPTRDGSRSRCPHA